MAQTAQNRGKKGKEVWTSLSGAEKGGGPVLLVELRGGEKKKKRGPGPACGCSKKGGMLSAEVEEKGAGERGERGISSSLRTNQKSPPPKNCPKHALLPMQKKKETRGFSPFVKKKGPRALLSYRLKMLKKKKGRLLSRKGFLTLYEN